MLNKTELFYAAIYNIILSAEESAFRTWLPGRLFKSVERNLYSDTSVSDSPLIFVIFLKALFAFNLCKHYLFKHLFDDGLT